MLKNASPIELDDEEETILAMEETSVQMGPLIEKKILQCERRKDDLGDLSEKFSQALNMYQQLMKEPVSVAPPVQNTTPQQPAGYSNPQQALQYQQAYAMQVLCSLGINSYFFVNPFHAIVLSLYLLKTSENRSFSDVFRGYRERPMA